MGQALTQIDAQIVEHASLGQASRDIAAQTGVSPSTVQRRLRREDIQAKVEALQATLINHALDKAASNVINLIDNYEQEDRQQRVDHGYKASIEVLRSAGLLPSQANSVIINNIYNDNRTSEIPPEIVQLMARQRPAIDADYQIVDQVEDSIEEQGNE